MKLRSIDIVVCVQCSFFVVAVLYRLTSLEADESTATVVLDPNTLSNDGTSSISLLVHDVLAKQLFVVVFVTSSVFLSLRNSRNVDDLRHLHKATRGPIG